MIKKSGILLGIIGISIIGIRLNQHQQSKKQDTHITIGILQTASHPALDCVRDSFIAKLKELIGSEVTCIIQNAEGSVMHAQTIAKSFQADHSIDAFFTIATMATQIMANNERDRPIIFAAVTDPHELGLDTQPNICGVSDMINILATIHLLQQLLPTAKTVALLFNTGEINAVIMANAMHQVLQQSGLKFIDIGITSESEIPSALTVACKKADVILTPLDNIVASSINLIAHQTLFHKKPLIVSDNLLVKHGALAASGVDYRTIGKQAAESLFDLLTKKKETD